MERGDIQMAIQMLLDEAEGDYDDPYALHHRLMETIHTLETEGMPVPDDLLALKTDLETVMGEVQNPTPDETESGDS